MNTSETANPPNLFIYFYFCFCSLLQIVTPYKFQLHHVVIESTKNNLGCLV